MKYPAVTSSCSVLFLFRWLGNVIFILESRMMMFSLCKDAYAKYWPTYQTLSWFLTCWAHLSTYCSCKMAVYCPSVCLCSVSCPVDSEDISLIRKLCHIEWQTCMYCMLKHILHSVNGGLKKNKKPLQLICIYLDKTICMLVHYFHLFFCNMVINSYLFKQWDSKSIVI